MAAISLATAASAAAFSSRVPSGGAAKLPPRPKCLPLSKSHFSSPSSSCPSSSRLPLHPKLTNKGLACSSRPSSSFVAARATPDGSATLSSGEIEKVQELSVYEINERDRDSPVYLRLSPKQVQNSLGDIVCFTNKLYTGDLQTRIGISSGICILVHHDEAKNGDRYEATYSLYFGDYGHMSIQGPYLSYDVDTILAVTAGTGIFEGVTGTVRLHQLLFPLKIFYTFHLKGIPDLPAELLGGDLVPPSAEVEASAAAKACEPHAVIRGYTH